MPVHDRADEHGHTPGFDAEDDAIVPDAHAAQADGCSRERFVERAGTAREHVAFDLRDDLGCDPVVEPDDRPARNRQTFN